MRLACFILSIIVLLMGNMPCSDITIGSLEDEVVSMLTKDFQEHGTQQDDCSPLCNCFCCSSSVVSFPVSLVAGYFAYSVSNYPPLVIGQVPLVSQTIWQPPQSS